MPSDDITRISVAGRVLRDATEFAALPPKYKAVYELLMSRARPGMLPGRQHFTPLDLPGLLGYVNLVDVVRDGGRLRFRFRLHGTKQTEMAGRDITGRFVEDAVMPGFIERLNRNMTLVAQTRCPVYDRFALPHPDRTYIDSERVYYPLAADGATVDMIFILNGTPASNSARFRAPSCARPRQSSTRVSQGSSPARPAGRPLATSQYVVAHICRYLYEAHMRGRATWTGC
ncbi:MAG: PAS domain-containing protein [Alphaproteobacteria bacterium]